MHAEVVVISLKYPMAEQTVQTVADEHVVHPAEQASQANGGVFPVKYPEGQVVAHAVFEGYK